MVVPFMMSGKPWGGTNFQGNIKDSCCWVASAVGNVKEAARNLGRGLGLHLKPSTQGLQCDSRYITVIMEVQALGHIWGMLPLLSKLVETIFKDERICRAEIYSLF